MHYLSPFHACDINFRIGAVFHELYSFEQHGYIAAIAKIVYIFFETPPFQSKIPILNEDPFECSKDSQIYSLLREFMAFLLFSKK